ncbi:MAG: acyl carrier protein [Odoribacter sp.]|nr:acyl carrier protein [Odoribacter sp.]
MDIEDFIANFANQFDETDPETFKIDTKFKEIEEWSSLIGLATLIMVERVYQVKLSPEVLKNTNTIQELFVLIQSKL